MENHQSPKNIVTNNKHFYLTIPFLFILVITDSNTVFDKLLNANRISLLKHLVNRKEMHNIGAALNEGYSFEELTYTIAKKDDEVLEHLYILKDLGMIEPYNNTEEGSRLVKATDKGIYTYHSLREWLLRVLT